MKLNKSLNDCTVGELRALTGDDDLSLLLDEEGKSGLLLANSKGLGVVLDMLRDQGDNRDIRPSSASSHDLASFAETVPEDELLNKTVAQLREGLTNLHDLDFHIRLDELGDDYLLLQARGKPVEIVYNILVSHGIIEAPQVEAAEA